MRKIKTIAIIVTMVLITPLIVMQVKTIQLRSNAPVEIGESEDHNSEELLKAAGVVKKSFNSWHYKKIIIIKYDELISRECIDDYNREHGTELNYHDAILFLCDYETNSHALQIAASPDAKYTDISFLLIRKGKGNKWEIIDAGEA